MRAIIEGQLSKTAQVLETPNAVSNHTKEGAFEMATATVSPIERFFKHVQKSDDPEGCWLWVGATDNRGYGQLHVDGRPVKAHRFSYQHHKGAIPHGLQVCHACDTPACVNPAHLWLGTAKDNMRDCGSKGRAHYQRYPEHVRRGEKHHRAKLTEAQAREIKRRFTAGGYTHRQLAEEYGVTTNTVGMLVRGITWKHLP